jgi:hypothetical protein
MEAAVSDKKQSTTNVQDADPFIENRLPAASWGEALLGALPFLLILLVDVLPKLLVEGGLLTWEAGGMRILNAGIIVLSIVTYLMILALAWRRRWPTWSATWYLLFCIPPLLLIIGLLSLLRQGQFDTTIDQDVVMYVWMPLLVAVLLYAVTRLDPLRGLLAALMVIYLLWQTNMEFVPDSIELTIKVPSIAMICALVVFTLRRGDWREGLFAVLAMNLAVGALFAYAGIYYGGTLPFVAPGPNPVEVARSLVPQYLATSAILLGPLFAWKFRQVGLVGGRGGKIAYHVVLGGLLLVIMANLANLMLTLQVDSPDSTSPASSTVAVVILLSLGIYLVGVIWLYRDTSFFRTAMGWTEGILLSSLPLGIPIALMLPFITWRWPVSNLYFIPLLWVLPHAISLLLGLVWLGLSVWVIARGETAQMSPHVGRLQPSTSTEIGDM